MGTRHYESGRQGSRKVDPPTTFMGNPVTSSSSPAQPESLCILTDFSDAMVNDLPDLCFDAVYSATPPSAASSSMLPTPLNNWTPLPQSSPDVVGDGKLTFGDSFDQWPMPTSESYYSDHHPDMFSSTDNYPSTSLFKFDSAMSETLTQELDWDYQRCLQEYSSSGAESSHDNPSLQTPTSYSLSTAAHDTPSRKSQVNTASVSSQAPSSPPPSTFTSPFNNTVSPSMLSLSGLTYSTFSHSTPAHPQVPLKLHQPKPSRKIPIVSLDRLASASEAFLASKHPRNASDLLDAQPHLNAPLPPLSPKRHDIMPIYPHTQRLQPHLPHALSQSQVFILAYRPMHSMTVPRQDGLSSVPMPMVSCDCGCNQSRTF
ncbi:hypothetical protein FA15DRAFT_266023 [Coprinopsis marcescibilis]|uniref:Uncharacterized protein n=1 Tax=Coprinopsis marcescibilis TaxID=230819 RepID=A0A5C3L190_COPMA|nr:hypothetical protein FA15DRAFT_266023 [Coprinopsis marcescibilis]